MKVTMMLVEYILENNLINNDGILFVNFQKVIMKLKKEIIYIYENMISIRKRSCYL